MGFHRGQIVYVKNKEIEILIPQNNSKISLKKANGITEYTSVAEISSNLIAIGLTSSDIEIFNISSLEVVYSLKSENKVIFLNALKDGSLVTSHSDNKINQWNLSKKSLILAFNHHNSNISYIAELKNGRLISGSSSDTIIHDLTNKNQHLRLKIASYSFAELEHNQIVVGKYAEIEIWDLTSKILLRKLVVHEQIVTALFVIPDGTLITGSLDTKIKSWNVINDLYINTFEHKSSIKLLSVLPNNKLVSASSDVIKIWEMDKCTEISYHLSFNP